MELTDRIIPSLGLGRPGPGRPPSVTDAELVCLAAAQVLLALNAAIWHNWQIGAPVKRSLIAYDN